ncbi:cytochrome P450 2C5 [Amia ocellicauda]|uniref:cytochrome P450 2C5 n=1 Tax=Amia ocellicauda TaxID=2972642 RepID=UPI003464A9C7
MELNPLSCALVALLLVLVAFLFRRDRATYSKLPPGPPPAFLVGNMLQLDRKAPFKSLVKLSERYGPVLTVYLGRKRCVVLVGYKAVQEALVDHSESFCGREPIPFFNRINRGYGLGISNGERWRQLRQFTVTTLRDFNMGKNKLETWIHEEARHLIEELEYTKGSPSDPTLLLNLSVSNVICSLVFGSRFDYQDQRFLRLLQLLKEMVHGMRGPWVQLYNTFPTIMDLLPGPHKNVFASAQQLADFMEDSVKEHKQTLRSTRPRDFIDCFLLRQEQEKNNSDSEFNSHNLIYTILGLFIAGTETTSTTLRYILMLLIKYPQVQERIQQEIKAVIGAQRRPALEDRTAMPFTDAVIHESQRLLDTVPMNLPHMATQDIFFRGYTIPKGTMVIPLLHSVLQDQEHWVSPDAFNPHHFLDEQGRFKRHPAFMAFSAGKRVCAGENLARAELFIFLVSLLQRFSFSCPLGPASICITPERSAFASVPQSYQLIATPR